MNGRKTVLGVRSNTLLFAAPIIILIFGTVCAFVPQINEFLLKFVGVNEENVYGLFGYDKVMLVELLLAFERNAIKYILPIIPMAITFIVSCYFLERVILPPVLIECDDEGIYLNGAFKKTNFLRYEEILTVYSKEDELEALEEESDKWESGARYWLSRPRLSVVKSATISHMKPKQTGKIRIGTYRGETFEVKGVKNALIVAGEIQRRKNDMVAIKEEQFQERISQRKKQKSENI